ncbi:UNVERIFIED_CONTAM: hypothetical protein FKN15_012102 [Acipenser sinensis]
MGHTEFEPNDGCISCWKQRHQIVFKCEHCKKQDTDSEFYLFFSGFVAGRTGPEVGTEAEARGWCRSVSKLCLDGLKTGGERDETDSLQDSCKFCSTILSPSNFFLSRLSFGGLFGPGRSIHSCIGVSPSFRLTDFLTQEMNCQASPSKALPFRYLVPSQLQDSCKFCSTILSPSNFFLSRLSFGGLFGPGRSIHSCIGVSPSFRLTDFLTQEMNCQASPSKALPFRYLVPSQYHGALRAVMKHYTCYSPSPGEPNILQHKGFAENSVHIQKHVTVNKT